MSDRPKTAHYRKCVVGDGSTGEKQEGQTLQSLLQAAESIVKRPWLRSLGASGAARQLLTVLMHKNSCLCGEIVFYEPGRKIPLVDIEVDGSTWRGAIHPQDATGKRREFQEHSLLFAVRENHVAIIQSLLLQADDLQSFLAWFIQSRAALAPLSLIALQNLPAKSALEKLKDHKIRGIKFGDRLFTSVREEVPIAAHEPPRKRKRYVQKLEVSPRMLEVLLGLGIAQPIIDRLKSNPDPGAIDVDVQISYRSRSEKEGVAVLHSLASTLGKQDGLETEILLDGKSSIKGNELSIREPILIQCPDGFMSVDDGLSKLSRWLAETVRSGRVT